jgi:hypothetical protein
MLLSNDSTLLGRETAASAESIGAVWRRAQATRTTWIIKLGQ